MAGQKNNGQAYAMNFECLLQFQSAHQRHAHEAVIGLRMAKKQKKRWSDEGANLLELVWVADINGERSPQALAALNDTSPDLNIFWKFKH